MSPKIPKIPMSEISLKHYIDTRIGEVKEQLRMFHDQQATALHAAKSDMDRRLEGMNQFREENELRTATFATIERIEAERDRNEREHKVVHDKLALLLSADTYHIEHRELSSKVGEIQTWINKQEGKNTKANIIAIVAAIISGIAVLVTILKLLKP